MPEATFPAAAMREQRRRADEYRRLAKLAEERCKALEAALRAKGVNPETVAMPRAA